MIFPDKYEGSPMMKKSAIANTTTGCVDSPNCVQDGIVALSPKTLAVIRPSVRRLRAWERYNAPSVAGLDEFWKKSSLTAKPTERRMISQLFFLRENKSDPLAFATGFVVRVASVSSTSNDADSVMNIETKDNGGYANNASITETIRNTIS